MRLKKTLILAAVLAAIVLYIRSYEIPARDAETKKDDIFKNAAAEEIQSITVTKGGESFTLVNTDPHTPPIKKIPEEEVEDSSDEITGKNERPFSWKFKDAAGALLDQGRVSSLASSIISLRSENTIAAADVDPDKKTYGLDAPGAVIEVTINGRTKKLKLGKMNEFLGKRYLEIEGDPSLYLISDSLSDAAAKKKDDYRDKTPISFTDESVTGLVVQHGDQTVELEPRPKQQWKIVRPYTATGSPFAVYDVYRNLRNLSAEHFIDEPAADPAVYGLDKPAAVITVKRKEGDVIASLGVKGDKTYFRVNGAGTVYEIKPETMNQFTADVTAYREKQLFRFDTYFADRLKVERPDGKNLELVKEKEAWKVNGKDADTPFVRKYLKDLSDVTAVNYPVEGKDLGFAKPRLKITLHIKEEDNSASDRTLVVGNKMDTAYAAVVEGTDEPFFITGENFDLINIREELLLPAAKDAAEPTRAPSPKP